jgi:hypothetical protein
MLEPDVGKLASPVLRGRGGGNIALLPGRLLIFRVNQITPRVRKGEII